MNNATLTAPGFRGAAGTLPAVPGPGPQPVPGVGIDALIVEPRWGLIVRITHVSYAIRDSGDPPGQWLYLLCWKQHRFQAGLPAVTGVTVIGGADEVRVISPAARPAAAAA